MNTKKKMTGLILATVAAAAFTMAPVTSTMASANGDMVKCMGVNACKGHGMCKTADNKCKGMNACKGKGWEMMSTKDCEDKGGKVLAAELKEEK